MSDENQIDALRDAGLSRPSEAEIAAQLDRIVNSREFITSRRLTDFLRFVTKCAVSNNVKSIKQYTIGVEVYDRDASFDPKSDPLVRIEASRLRRTLDKYYEGTGKSDPVYIEVPRGSYVPRFSYVQTFQGLHSSTAGSSDHDSLIPLQKPIVAVFPLENLGDDQDNYLVNGIGEELTAELSRCPDLRVLAFSSTVQFSSRSTNISTSAAALGADFALSGCLRRSGERVRINVNLLEVSSGEQIWAERFDEAFSPSRFFEIEDRITHQVLARVADTYGVILRLVSGRAQTRRVTDSSAFAAIMRHHHYQLMLTPEAFQDALKALQHAAKRSSSSATISAMLGMLYFDSEVFGYAEIPEALEKGILLAGKAVSLDPDCQYAQLTMAYAGMIEKDRRVMIAAADRIVAANPNAAYMGGVAGFWLCLAGEYERGITLFKRSVELNPLHPSWLHAAPYFYYLHKNLPEQALHHANAFGLPEFFWGPIMRAAALGLLGRMKEAKVALERLASLKPDLLGREEDYIRVFVLDDELVDMMLEGLRAAA